MSGPGTAAVGAQDSTGVAVLPEVGVNVLRTGLGLALMPFSIEVLGSARTQRRGPGLGVAEALQGLAGVQADDRHNQALGERLSIRGSGARSTFGIRGIRVLVDGIPATMPDGQTTLNHVDPGQIVGAELVRGPASAFLGNAAGGALHLRTGAGHDPGVETTVGARGLWRLRFSAADQRRAAYASWQRLAGFRAYSGAERVIMGVVISAASRDNRFDGALHATRYEAENPGSLTAAQAAADPTQANPANEAQRTAERGTHVELGGGWERLVGGLALSVRGYAGSRDLFNPIPPRIIELDRTFAGIRAQCGRTGQHYQWTVGGELETQHDDRINHVNEAGHRGALVLDQRERVRGAAGFIQGGWSPWSVLQLYGALRRDRYRFGVIDQLITADNPNDSGSRTLQATSLAGGAGILIAPAWQVFGSVSTGFETPTTTELANRPDGAGGFNSALQPERTRAGELGLRASTSTWSAAATVFRADVRDKLIPFEVPALPGRQFFRNAGRARHQGVELTASLQPLPGLAVSASYTRLDARFGRYVVAGADFAGRLVPGVAGHRLAMESDIGLGSRRQLLVRLVRNGPVPVNDANDARAAPFTSIGGRLLQDGLAAGPLALTWELGVENALDRAYTAAVSVNAAGARYYEPGPGRTWYVAVGMGPRAR